jgi:phosphatidylinositol alpha-mannosyltransferase
MLALSMGLPAVVADRESYRELLAGGRAGWLFESGDAASLRRALDAAASSPDDATRMGAVGLRQATARGWPETALLTAQALIGGG